MMHITSRYRPAHLQNVSVCLAVIKFKQGYGQEKALPWKLPVCKGFIEKRH